MSKPELKPLNEQVVVVVGAASGIGRLSALEFGRAGSKVVVAARDEEALRSLVSEIKQAGGEAIYVVCDVAHYDQIENVAVQTVEKFGRIDSWVHTAAAALYAKFEDISPDEFKRVIDVTLTGAAWSAMVALPRLKISKGALIQVSSVEAIVAIPYQSAYGAAKHGMKCYLDCLRIELDRDHVPVSVTNIMPSGINTPFFNNARTKLGVKPVATPPIYHPKFVAGAILAAAQKPIPEIIVGGAGWLFALTERSAPHIAHLFQKLTADVQKTKELKSENAPTNLFSPDTKDARVEGDFSASARGTSVVTWLETHPTVRTALGYSILALLVLWHQREVKKLSE